jgi:hypothetical protein
MTVTLYFGNEAKEMSMRRNTARLRLDWQRLYAQQTSASKELGQKSTDWTLRSINCAGKMKDLDEGLRSDPTNVELAKQFLEVKNVELDLAEEWRNFKIELEIEATNQLIDQAKLLINSDELTSKEGEQFSSPCEGEFWQNQDIEQIAKVVTFFRRTMGEGRQPDTGYTE